MYVGAFPIGPVPPLGALVDPWRGVWALARSARHPDSLDVMVPSLLQPVSVVYDDRGVPHIFAENELDAIRALGYVVARDRLFQLELQTHAANGTLTQLVGERALGADREARNLGMPWGARRKFAAIDSTSATMQAITAYADGVNSYIRGMRAQDLPFEYRLLARTPQQWRPEYTMSLLVRMGYTLAYSDFEFVRPRLEARIGRRAVDALFPAHAYVQEPIQPNGENAPRIDDVTLPPPIPDSTSRAFSRIIAAVAPARAREAEVVVGSNSWVVAPSRSASGYALFANDPHLELSLPSVWYEAHIVVRDSIDVYGVTFPGAPSIVLGLNRDVAWGATNVGADVTDYYLETVDEPVAPRRYMVDGEWRNLEFTVEEYRDPSGTIIATDTIRYTHRGPMVRAAPRWVSTRWLVLDPSNDFEAFRLAQRATSVSEYLSAMSALRSPAQNVTAADRAGHIAIRSTGAFPVHRGDRLLDGSTSEYDWTEWMRGMPATIDPPQGFAASANQQPADPRVLPSYMGNEWPTPWRAMRINELLRKNARVSAEDMRRFQTDPGSARADAFVPFFLDAASRDTTDTVVVRAARLLGDWDRTYALDNERAVLFESAMRFLALRTWDELATFDSTGAPTENLIATPAEGVLLALANDSASVWWDVRSTPQREDRDAVLRDALALAVARVEADRGRVEEGRWRWSQIRRANVWHALRSPALSALDLSIQGGNGTLNPSSGTGTHGASWRLVAEMGPVIRAWAIYPGGQSANPVSTRYRDRIETWRRGDLDSLRIPRTRAELMDVHRSALLTLVPGTH